MPGVFPRIRRFLRWIVPGSHIRLPKPVRLRRSQLPSLAGGQRWHEINPKEIKRVGISERVIVLKWEKGNGTPAYAVLHDGLMGRCPPKALKRATLVFVARK